MKKLLSIIFVSLLLSGNAYSSCLDDLNISAKYGPGKTFLLWTAKNKGNRDIKITKLALMSEDGKIMREKKPEVREDPEMAVLVGDDDFYLKPYAVSKPIMFIDDLNLDVAGNISYACRYGTITYTNQTNSSSNSSSNSNSNSSKSKQKSETSGSSKSLLKKLLGKN